MNDTAAGAPGEENRPSQGVPEFTWPDYIGWGWMIIQARMEATGKEYGTMPYRTCTPRRRP